MNTSSTMQTIWVTSKGLQKLKAEHAQLKSYMQMLRREIRSATLTFDTDITVEKKREQEVAATKLSKLESMLQRAKLLTKRATQKADVGSKILYRQGDEIRTVTLVSTVEADPFEGFISVESPLGMALLGKQAGDIAHMLTPVGEREFEIVEIQ